MMMSRIPLVLVVFILLSVNILFAQDHFAPVRWHIFTESIGNGQFKVHFDAYIDDEWMIYSSISPEGGPIPTDITFDHTPGVKIEEDLIEITKPKTEFEALFGQNVMKLTKKAEFVKIVKSEVREAVSKGFITYMACNGRQCLPPTDVPFIVVLN